MPYFKTKDGCSLYYETQAFESSNPVVAFLNGTMQSTLYWKACSMAFKKRFRVLMYDARAQGQSDLGKRTLSLEGHAEDFSALLKYLNIAKVHLVGLSHGAKVALAYAACSPECVDRLVLCSVSAKQTYRARLIVRSWLEVLKSADIETLAWSALTVSFGDDFLKQKAKTLNHIVAAIVRRNRKEALTAHLEAMTLYPPLAPIARNVNCPALVLSGADDPLVTQEAAKQLALLCGGRHKHITGIGHSIPVEASDLFNKTVLQFLDET